MKKHRHLKFSSHSEAGDNHLRIIGGQWRGRVLKFPNAPDLRPTGSRVRETLFNWLQHCIPGSHCLDLFAGSGVLGIEAVSRGAESATLVDSHPKVVRVLYNTIAELESDSLFVVQGTALNFLRAVTQPFDIVFLDPPFSDNGLQTLVAALTQKTIKKNGYIYIEQGKWANIPELPENWEILREKTFANVKCWLVEVH